ncbi:MAG TPA: T9SS type A sorting domain-containing protein [Flavobacteriales bacterium]|nr:T9SS type A sorting domain-containing protein [Flavobacteriales bacterium]
MYRSFLCAGSLATALFGFRAPTQAQSHVHQVVVLNEGRYDYTAGQQIVPVSIGSYDPELGSYTETAIIPHARFGNDVKVENELVYVSADSFLLKYDANTFDLLDQEIIHGIRRIALWNDRILLTRGEYGVTFDHFVEVRDKNTFDLIYTLGSADGVEYTCEAVEVLNDKAYISMNNGFDFPNYTNKVVVVDLEGEAYESTIDLGPDGYNPEHIMVSDGNVYVFNNKDYTGSSISRIDPVGSSLMVTNNVAYNSGCGTSTAAAGRIYYMEYSVAQLARYDLTTEQVYDTLDNGIEAYGVLGDPINNVMYVSSTDFTSTGTLYVTENDGSILSSVGIGVAAGKMALDLRTSTGIGRIGEEVLRIFPNPAVDDLTVSFTAPGRAQKVIVMDASGRVVLRHLWASAGVQRMSTADLAPGIYTLTVEGVGTTRFSKR